MSSDLAQAAESEKRAAQAAQVQMERQMAGMRFDAETRMHELEQRAISAGQSEAVALARCKEIEQSYEQLRRQYDELASQKKRVDEALRSVMGINESLLGRISSCGDAPRLPMPKERVVVVVVVVVRWAVGVVADSVRRHNRRRYRPTRCRTLQRRCLLIATVTRHPASCVGSRRR